MGAPDQTGLTDAFESRRRQSRRDQPEPGRQVTSRYPEVTRGLARDARRWSRPGPLIDVSSGC